MTATADLALVIVVVLVVLSTTGAGTALLRWWHRAADERREADLHAEALKQERIRTQILEEQLKNEILKDLDPKG